MSLDVTCPESLLGRALLGARSSFERGGDAGGERRVDVVVHLGPAALRDARLDIAIEQCVDETRRAVERAVKHAASANGRSVPLVLVSTLAAIGRKKGLVAEEDPRSSLFGANANAPRGNDLDLDAEIAACRNAIAHAKQSASFADVRSRIAAETREKLVELGGASTGTAFARAFDDGCAAELRQNLERALVERASGWGFGTGSAYATLGYAAALAELVAAGECESRNVPLAIVRVPDLLDDDDPDRAALAWLLSLVRSSHVRLPVAAHARLEALPADDVARAIQIVARGLAASPSAISVVHVNASEPLLGSRVGDLLDLHLRRGERDGRDGAVNRALVRALSVDTGDVRPPLSSLAASAFSFARGLLPSAASATLPAALEDFVPAQVRDAIDETARAMRSVVDDEPRDRARGHAAPFFSDETRFSQRGLRMFATRAALDAPKLVAGGWRALLLDDVLPALDEARAIRERAKLTLPRAAYDSLPHLLEEIAARYTTRPALSLFVGDDVVDVTFTELKARALSAARFLRAAGVDRGDRVLLAGANHPDWGIAAFGIFCAGAICVPLDPGLDDDAVARIHKKSRPKIAILDDVQAAKWAQSLPVEIVRDVHMVARDGARLDEPVTVASDDVASILFTSGTTGDPKGVELTHRNFTSLLASLQSIFPVGRGDRLLSVLPIHHTFEFTCGFLMPLAAGARIYTPESRERVLFALQHGKITAMVGVPALWQVLERRVRQQAKERGDVVEGVLNALLSANRAFASKTGMSFGKLAFKPILDELGGNLRTLISGGSALPPSTFELFQGLGLPLAEGYGLTEAAPVLTVAEGVLGAPPGHVGKPIPGVELKLVDGEIWAKAPNVMRGYFEDAASTSAVKVDGWLRTGDIGKIDDEGRLRIVGRSKDVVVTKSGENVYLDDIEKKLERIDGVSELTLLGMPEPAGVGERLACAWVVAENSDVSDAEKALKQRILKLAAFARPSVVERVDGPLPLTATRKVKRKEVKRTLEEILAKRAESEAARGNDVPLSAVRAAITVVVGEVKRPLTGATRLADDLGFDSLMWTELGAALEPLAGKIDPEALVACETVASLENLVRKQAQDAANVPLANAANAANAALGAQPSLRHASRQRDALSDDTARATSTPPKKSVRDRLADIALIAAKPFGRAALTVAQREAYRTIFSSTVTGRAFIPHNRNAIVVANHTSHLDTGLVKFALADYGRDLRPLAAKDYFFEGAAPKVAFFEHFTNLVPIDRETGSGLAFEQARAVVDGGHVVLVFPEGTRREDGTLGEFKPLVARLSLETGVDVLPIWMRGNFDALPRGSLVPNLRARDLEAHIGPPLPAKDLARLTAHLDKVARARKSTEIIRKAIVALSEGRMLDLSRVKNLEELERGVVTRPAADVA